MRGGTCSCCACHTRAYVKLPACPTMSIRTSHIQRSLFHAVYAGRAGTVRGQSG